MLIELPMSVVNSPNFEKAVLSRNQSGTLGWELRLSVRTEK